MSKAPKHKATQEEMLKAIASLSDEMLPYDFVTRRHRLALIQCILDGSDPKNILNQVHDLQVRFSTLRSFCAQAEEISGLREVLDGSE